MAFYTDVHRAFLQALSHHGAVNGKQAHSILQTICEKHPTGGAVPMRYNVISVTEAINARIARYSQKIKLIRYELSGMDFLVFCNVSDSPMDRMQTCYTEPEVTYFGLVLKEIACSDGHRAKDIVCLNLNVQVQGSSRSSALSKVRAENLLDEWTKSGYFGQLGGIMTLGPRTVAEFGHFLRVHYGDKVAICLMCKEAVFYGFKCSNCPETFHSYCKEIILRRSTNCPGCQKMVDVPEIA